MNKIRLIIIILIPVLFTSCEKYLDLKPKNVVAIKSLPEIKEMMSSYFYMMQDGDTWTRQIMYNEKNLEFPFDKEVQTNFLLLDDNIDLSTFLNSYYGRVYENEYFRAINWNSEQFSSLYWSRLYESIGYLNTVIAELNELDEFEKDEFEIVKGEALVMRSYFIFKLLQVYSPYKDNELGIPLNLDPEVIIGGERWSQTKVYKQITEDLVEALQYETGKTSWNAFYSKDIINLMLAQVYLYKSGSGATSDDDLKLAESYSNKIVVNNELANSVVDLRAMFTANKYGLSTNNPHAFLIIGRKRNPKNNFFAPFGFTAADALTPASGLSQLYSGQDIRIAAFFNSQMGIKKWTFSFTGGAFDLVTLFRVADAYLINAEANAKLGDNTKAISVLEKFKRARILNYTSYNGGDLLTEIYNERRKEFCYENDYRWIDLKRTGAEFTRTGINSETKQLENYTINANDYRYTFPIPLEEELKYNNIPQNPGWN
ncbi:RagB/SusD family nutrient uptake outer membrane protein [Marinifilum caeruleilacunae]|uniref:RagB/SusD family nutrient uptake outer membrane protein n=1 Tax=Marinifilum caeruleilacunae TaxID=2499076 RepID=A0ABX1WU25_9BACT|nr:RagB/SusD family nutrient uptake outer membrane protein [Marinifilum caeruleilacunae]NOU59609.1 RagB/SusD family nutrient uptake outer membrane protein [Marinifilum caeruleilacunae]